MDNFLVESGIELRYFIAFLTGSLEIFSAAVFGVSASGKKRIFGFWVWLDTDHERDGS